MVLFVKRLPIFVLTLFTVLINSEAARAQPWQKLDDIRIDGNSVGSVRPHVLPGDPKLYAATNFGVFTSTDHGNTWTQFGSQIFEAYRLLRTQQGTLIQYGGSLHYTTDNGSTWVMNVPTLENNGISGLVQLLSGELIAATYNHAVMRSTDDGVTWEPYGNISDSLPGYEMFLLKSGDLLALCGTPLRLFRSSDKGATWTLSNTGIQQGLVTGIAQDSTGVVYVTSAYGDQGVFRSTDDGRSWSPMNTGLGDGSEDALAITVALDSSLFVSTDYTAGLSYGMNRSRDRETWNLAMTGIPAPTQFHVITADRDGYVYISYGDALFRTNVYASSVASHPNPSHLSWSLSSDQLIVKQLPEDASTVELYDVLGRRRLEAEISGSEIRLSRQGLEPGIYFLVTTGSRREVVTVSLP